VLAGDCSARRAEACARARALDRPAEAATAAVRLTIKQSLFLCKNLKFKGQTTVIDEFPILRLPFNFTELV